MWSPATRSEYLYGAVPTGWVILAGVFGATFTEAGEMIDEFVWVIAAAKGANGVWRTNWTCVASTATTWSMPVLPPRTPGTALKVFGSSRRSMLNLTACALNGVPSENLTPWRSVNVQVRPSLLVVQEVASRGFSAPLLSSVTSVSVIMSTTWDAVVVVWAAGSRVSGSMPMATLRVSPCFGPDDACCGCPPPVPHAVSTRPDSNSKVMTRRRNRIPLPLSLCRLQGEGCREYRPASPPRLRGNLLAESVHDRVQDGSPHLGGGADRVPEDAVGRDRAHGAGQNVVQA